MFNFICKSKNFDDEFKGLILICMLNFNNFLDNRFYKTGVYKTHTSVLMCLKS